MGSAFHPTTKLDCSFVDEASKTLGHGFFSSVEAVLMACHPGYFAIGDDTGGHGFEEDLSKGHQASAASCRLKKGCLACSSSSPFFMDIAVMNNRQGLVELMFKGAVRDRVDREHVLEAF